MKAQTLIPILAVLLVGTVNAQQTPKELLKNAKSICVTAPEGPSADLKTEISNKLTEWGKLTVLTDCQSYQVELSWPSDRRGLR